MTAIPQRPKLVFKQTTVIIFASIQEELGAMLVVCFVLFLVYIPVLAIKLNRLFVWDAILSPLVVVCIDSFFILLLGHDARNLLWSEILHGHFWLFLGLPLILISWGLQHLFAKKKLNPRWGMLLAIVLGAALAMARPVVVS